MLLSHELATFSLLITINHIQNCGTKYWNLIFSLFINFLLWHSVQFYSHRYISETKNIYSFINQILQLKSKTKFTLPRGWIDANFFSMPMALHIKFSCIRQMLYSKVMTWMMLHSQRDADIYIYIYIYIFFFSFFLITMLIHIPSFNSIFLLTFYYEVVRNSIVIVIFLKKKIFIASSIKYCN